MDSLTIVAVTFTALSAALLLIFWSGFRRSFDGFPPEAVQESFQSIPLPDHLPDLIKRHLRSIFEAHGIMQIHSLKVWGKARYQISGIWMPVRYHSFYIAGEAFVRRLEFFWHRKTILKGIDYYSQGTGSLDVNGIIRMSESGDKVDRSQWIGLWAESLITSCIDLTDERLRWEVPDRMTVDLVIPNMPGRNDSPPDRLRIRFHPETGRISSVSAPRYRGQLGKKLLTWQIRIRRWHRHKALWMPEYEVLWEDQKKPWCSYKIEGFSVNAEAGRAFDMIQNDAVIKKTGAKSRRKK
jgi:hypothetical protein